MKQKIIFLKLNFNNDQHVIFYWNNLSDQRLQIKVQLNLKFGSLISRDRCYQTLYQLIWLNSSHFLDKFISNFKFNYYVKE